MEFKLIKREIENNIAILSLARIERLNAVNLELATEILESFKELINVNEVRVIILKSNARAFCAGIDLKYAMSGVVDDVGKSSDSGERSHPLLDCCHIIEECMKPVIAAVHGACVGAGLDIISACDIRLCSDDATFSLREAGMGLVADMGSIQRLPSVIGQGFTREMAFTARFFTAKEAERMNLVNVVYPDREALMEGAKKLATTIAENPPLAVQASKELLNRSRYLQVKEGMLLGGKMNSRLFGTEDFKEAAMAFLQKRKPDFRGK